MAEAEHLDRNLGSGNAIIRRGNRFGTNADKHPGAIRLGQNTSFPVCAPEFAGSLDDWQNANLFDCTGVRANWESWARYRNETLPRGKQVNLANNLLCFHCRQP